MMQVMRGVPRQRRMVPAGAIVGKESVGLGLHRIRIGQGGILPDMSLVLLMEPFNAAVMLWVIDG
jgi:hypothetical protein